MLDLNSVLGYIRRVLGFASESPRKRRADDFEVNFDIPSKYRKVSIGSQMSNDEDWISIASSSRRNSLNNISHNLSSSSLNNSKPKAQWTKVPVIDLSDEDDEPPEVLLSSSKSKTKRIFDHNFSSSSSKHFSTPWNPVKKLDKIPTIDLSSSSNDRKNLTNGSSDGWKFSDKTNFLTPFMTRHSLKEHAAASGGSFKLRQNRSTMLEESCRLDDKRRYKELLRSAAPNATLESIAQSFTPFGSGTRYGSTPRGKFLADLSIEKSNGTPLSRPLNGSVKRAIQKILDEPITIKDSSDDDGDVKLVKVEALTPLEAKNIRKKLESTSSLQKLIDTYPSASKEWIAESTERLKEDQAKKIKDAELHRLHRERCKVVNNEILKKSLEVQFQRSLKLKEAVIPIEEDEEDVIIEFNPEQNQLIDQAFVPYPKNEVLIDKFSLRVTRADIQTLAGLNWLNDEIINFYCNLIMQRSERDERLPKVYCFNTFFYPKLDRDGYSSLRRWTKKVDVFAKDILVAPIHLGVHWCVAIIDFRSKRIEYYDSMSGSNQKCLKLLLDYLRLEHEDKKKYSYDTSGWTAEIMKNIPQQMNGSDCGMFSLMFAEYVTRNAKITFDQSYMPYFRRKMVYEIIHGELLR